jgi:nicotinate-nucleotide adenylyltransferase
LFVVASNPPHKNKDEYVDGKHRLEMCKLATMGYKDFEVSDYELTQETTSYTIRTVRHFAQLYSGAKLFLLVGTDSLLTFDTWHEWEELAGRVTLVHIPRKLKDNETSNVKEILQSEKISKITEKCGIITVPAPIVDISSSHIRKNIQEFLKTTCFLPENVVKYIQEQKLWLG